MTTKSSIEWTEMTWNPTVGCTKISPGCKNCYAETMAKRLQAMGAPGYEHGFQHMTLLPSRLAEPLKRQKPTTFFVNSMSDLFEERVPDAFIDQVMEVIAKGPQHTFQILTKRAERMANYFTAKGRVVPPNAWLGVSVENRKHGLPRIRHLRRVPARVRFLSVEPLLEDLGVVDLAGIHWMIVGGESGARARPMMPGWVTSLQMQCEHSGTFFHFKQWGAYGEDSQRRAKRLNGRHLGGRTWDGMPAVEAGEFACTQSTPQSR